MSIVIAEFTEQPSLGDLKIDIVGFRVLVGVDASSVPCSETFGSPCIFVVLTETSSLKLKFTQLVNLTSVSSSSLSMFCRSISQGIFAASASSSFASFSLGVIILSFSSSQVDALASCTA